jgi:hypothetical protein
MTLSFLLCLRSALEVISIRNVDSVVDLLVFVIFFGGGGREAFGDCFVGGVVVDVC